MESLCQKTASPLYRLVPERGCPSRDGAGGCERSLEWASGEEAQLSPFPFLSLFHKMNRSDIPDFRAPWAIFRFVFLNMYGVGPHIAFEI